MAFPGGQYLFNNSNPTRNYRSNNGGSPIQGSPNRSPGPHMFNQNSHRQNHGIQLNGGGPHQKYNGMGMHNNFQSQNHGHQAHHVSSQHQDHGGMGGPGGFGNHQHTMSSGTLSNATPLFTPAHLQNGTPDNSGALTKPLNENYAEQQREYAKLRGAGDKPHFYARTTPHVSRQPGSNSSMSNARLTDADEHGTRSSRTGEEEPSNNLWDALDLGGHGLKSMGSTLYRYYPHLRKIYFNHNRLSILQPQISAMHNLTILDLSFNQLSELPPEIGMLTNLKKLLLFENNLQDIPMEIGYLYQLEMLGLEGNPMRSQHGRDFMDRLAEHGTQELVRYLREEAPRKRYTL